VNEEDTVKKALTVVLEDKDIIELMRILMDHDAEGALDFLREHFKGKARDLLEGGWRVMIEVPGKGATSISGHMFKK
jgi:hypothetical protein